MKILRNGKIPLQRMMKKISDFCNNLISSILILADFINLFSVFLLMLLVFFVDNHVAKCGYISCISIFVTFIYYLKLNYNYFENHFFQINDLICMFFWCVISAYWFSSFLIAM